MASEEVLEAAEVLAVELEAAWDVAQVLEPPVDWAPHPMTTNNKRIMNLVVDTNFEKGTTHLYQSI